MDTRDATPPEDELPSVLVPTVGSDYNLQKAREDVRGQLACGLLVLLAAETVAMLFAVLSGWQSWQSRSERNRILGESRRRALRPPP